MKNLNLVNFEGINYYNVKGSKVVNVTEDLVTEDNYQDVADIDSFNVKEALYDSEALEVEVMDYVATSKLKTDILKDIKKLTTISNAHTIIGRIDNQKAIRENYVLAKYESMELEGNMLHIYAEDGYGISIDFRLDEPSKFGSIVG